MTPAINPCHGFLVIAGVVDLIPEINLFAGDNDSGEQLSPLSLTIEIRL
jgi:hypothetical protein